MSWLRLDRPPPADLALRLEQERLKLLAQSMRRPPWVGLSFSVIGTWLLWRSGWPGPAAAWLLAMVAIHALRRRRVLAWQAQPAPPARQATRWLARVTLVQALLMVGLVLLVFLGDDPLGPYVATVLAMGMATGAAGVGGWPLRVFALWCLLVGGTLVAGWLWQHQAVGLGMAIAMASLLALLLLQVRDQQQALLRLVTLSWDNERLAASLRDERDRAQAASASKTRFFAAASHDLRQPLHALSISATALALLAQRQGDARITRLGEGIDQALRQSNHLLDALLDVSRLDAGAVAPEPVTVDAVALLDGVALEFAALAAQRGLQLQVVAPPPSPADGPMRVHTDPDLLRRVLHNLVANSLKFTRQGGVTLSAQRLADGQITLAVADTGPGIAPAEQQRVFEEFYQTDNPARDRGQGLGLGLAIVRRIAELLGLVLTLDSAPGAGTRIALRLPAAPHSLPVAPAAAAGPAGMAPTPASALAQTRHILAGLPVLVVDDEPAIREASALLLAELGCQPRCVAGRGDAMAVLDQGWRPAVLVVDQRLPGDTGLGLIAALRHRLGPLPVLLLTGDTEPQALQQALAGGHPVLHKPLDGVRLAAALCALVQPPAGTPVDRPGA